MLRWSFFAIVLLLSAVPCAFAEEPIAEVTAVGPSWETFTNTDGTGLYHEILEKLFALYGVRYAHLYAPSERAYHLVREGKADFMTCHDKVEPPLTLARHPMYENAYYVFFKKANIGEWKGAESLRGRSVAWRIGYYDVSNFSAPVAPREVKTGVSGLGMVLLDRADFYVDDMSLIEESMRENSIPFDMADYDIEPVGRRTYHPVFMDSERGRRIMEMYDQGMERLFRSGELQRIFAKWGLPLPHYDFSKIVN